MDSTDSESAEEWGIAERIERLETIAETLEEGEVGLESAKDLREEADEHLAALREELDVGDGEIIEMEAEAVEPDEE
jgi:exonuclease VII small subunit